MAEIVTQHGNRGKALPGAAWFLPPLGVGALALSNWGSTGSQRPSPGDNVTVFVPIGLMVVLSIAGKIVLNHLPPALAQLRL